MIPVVRDYNGKLESLCECISYHQILTNYGQNLCREYSESLMQLEKMKLCFCLLLIYHQLR